MPGLCGGTNEYPVYDMYSLDVIVIARCPCRPPPIFDAIDAAFPLSDQCRSIRASPVGSLTILGSMGVRTYVRTPLTLIFAPNILSCALGGIDGGFVPWDNLSNLLKR